MKPLGRESPVGARLLIRQNVRRGSAFTMRPLIRPVGHLLPAWRLGRRAGCGTKGNAPPVRRQNDRSCVPAVGERPRTPRANARSASLPSRSHAFAEPNARSSASKHGAIADRLKRSREAGRTGRGSLHFCSVFCSGSRTRNDAVRALRSSNSAAACARTACTSCPRCIA
jgi:hypothetical protein